MKTTRIFFFLAVLLLLAACTVPPTVEVSLPAPTAVQPVSKVTSAATATLAPAPTSAALTFKSAAGDLVYVSSRFVEEVNGVTPAEGCRLLLVVLARADGGSIDLQKFADAHTQIFIRGKDGADTLSTMGGFVGQEFAIGFQLPKEVKSYRLVWGDQPPVEIFPAE